MTVPLGKPLELTDEEMDALAQITPEDIRAARELWIKANPELAGLLDADEADDLTTDAGVVRALRRRGL